MRRALFGQAVPRVVGRYRVERRCGRGAMGSVFEAYDPELDRQVALKLLEGSHASSDALERLQRQVLHEARAMARLHHPAVVSVYEVGRHEPWVFIAMELVTGPSLRDWIVRARPDWRRLVEAFVHVGEGLAAAHDAGLAHGDFKPDNLRFDARGKLRILDFGLARSVRAAVGVAPGHSVEEPGSLLLSTGVEGFGGTPIYAAPERLDGAPADQRSDQFSFFVALHECLFGRRPFTGQSLEELARAIARGPERTGVPRGPVALRSAIEQGLAERPENRHASMHQACIKLTAIARRRPARWLLGGGLLALTGAGGWWMADRGATSHCASSPRLAHELWNDDVKAEVSRARPSRDGAVRWERLEPELDRYVEGWATVSRDACRQAEGGRDPLEAADALACSRRGKAAFERLLVRLRRGDGQTWQRGLQAVADLPALRACDEPPEGANAVAPPRAEQRADVDAIREGLAVARVDADAGDLESALASVRELHARAVEVDYGPVVAEALAVQGKFLADLGRVDEGSELLKAAHGRALAVGHLELAADTAVALVYVDGHQRADTDMGHHWAWVARQLLDGGAIGGGLRSSLVSNEAAVYVEEGRYDEADRAFAEAIELERKEAQPDPITLDSLQHNRGAVAIRAGEFERALRIHRDVLEHRRTFYGEQHPQVARGLSSLAAAERGLGMRDEALEHDAQAVAKFEALYGPESSASTLALLGLGQSQSELGRFDEAARNPATKRRAGSSVHASSRGTAGDRAGLLVPLR